MVNAFDMSVPEYFQVSKTEGEIGIEIEMETQKALSSEYVDDNYWFIEEDGSLQGYGGELVLKNPCNRNEVGPIIQSLRKDLINSGVKIKNSIRAGIHIHINCQDMRVGEVLKFMACYYPLETVFTNFCGDNRQGNLFCLRTRDAYGMIFRLSKCISDKNLYNMRSDDYRYASLNMQSLFNYGSLEFRSMATNSELSNIENWVNIITRLKDYSRKVNSSWDNLSKISGMGAYQWLEEVVGPDYVELLCYPGIDDDIMDDARNIQMVCHAMSKKGL